MQSTSSIIATHSIFPPSPVPPPRQDIIIGKEVVERETQQGASLYDEAPCGWG